MGEDRDEDGIGPLLFSSPSLPSSLCSSPPATIYQLLSISLHVMSGNDHGTCDEGFAEGCQQAGIGVGTIGGEGSGGGEGDDMDLEGIIQAAGSGAADSPLDAPSMPGHQPRGLAFELLESGHIAIAQPETYHQNQLFVHKQKYGAAI